MHFLGISNNLTFVVIYCHCLIMARSCLRYISKELENLHFLKIILIPTPREMLISIQYKCQSKCSTKYILLWYWEYMFYIIVVQHFSIFPNLFTWQPFCNNIISMMYHTRTCFFSKEHMILFSAGVSCFMGQFMYWCFLICFLVFNLLMSNFQDVYRQHIIIVYSNTNMLFIETNSYRLGCTCKSSIGFLHY